MTFRAERISAVDNEIPSSDSRPKSTAESGLVRVTSYEGLVTAFASATAFLTFGLLTLSRAHPEEDAYIMFRYAQHVAQGRGIVFNANGPHAEGATDFLWMIMLSGLNAVGVDAAVAAVILNAVGAGLAAFVLSNAIAPSLPRGARWLWASLVCAAVVLSSAALAAYGGFSSMLYTGLVLGATHLSLYGSRRAVSWLPAFALGIGLFRPDGVVLGGSIAILGALRARDLDAARTYYKASGAALLGGAVYAVWRYWYFGLPLPLPLYVKSRVGDIDKLARLPPVIQALARKLPGLGADLHWLVVGGALGSIFAAAVALLFLYRTERSIPTLVRRALGALPFAMLFASLAFAYQTQNLRWRFEAPIQLAALYFAARGVSAVVTRGLMRGAVGAAMLGVSAFLVIAPGPANLENVLDPSRGGYVTVFAARYGRDIPAGTKIAVSEAGRVPYWSSTEVLDTVGLNSPDAAVHPVTRKLLADFNPAILFFHTASTIDFSSVPRGDPVIALPAFNPGMIREWYRPAYDRDFDEYSEFPFSSIRLPPLAAAHFLQDHASSYTVFAADEDGDRSYNHIWAFRNDVDATRAKQELEAALRPDNRPSYFALTRERGTPRAAARAGDSSK